MRKLACSYVQKYILVVIEGFFSSMNIFRFNCAIHKNWYNLHSVLSSVFGVLSGCVGFGDQLYATTIAGRYSTLKIIAHLCNFRWKINHSERVSVT